MASPRLPLLLRLVPLVLLCLSPACAAGRVPVSVYYETLCPFCSAFVVNDLARIFHDGVSSIADLRLVPFGNGRVSADGSISCQHGEGECQLNAIEACVIRLWPNAVLPISMNREHTISLNKEQHFPFVQCVEHLALTRKWDAWQSCFQETGLASQPVIDCYNSGYGRQNIRIPSLSFRNLTSNQTGITQLELQNAAETNALQPPHQFVPWVVVNGKPLGEDYMNFEAYICSVYDGKLPEACKGKHLAIAQHTEASGGEKINWSPFVHNNRNRKQYAIPEELQSCSRRAGLVTCSRLRRRPAQAARADTGESPAVNRSVGPRFEVRRTESKKVLNRMAISVGCEHVTATGRCAVNKS
ncbi:gamma-interferon-inducible lysosomal thiol reductase-like isoform X2 [Panicum miliaceum]|uniref:Gamma-interferon-inducible lysosomal thiol reductase-like isoform X2 n=1 Tax=Panicum miliaceum TaxID=4540 RepID=A0A3L6R3Y9_PANMI|nr:gamma-interferon-inducible lysosomal thiol reductase-like isoform X2 [Panicum miliaceum]